MKGTTFGSHNSITLQIVNLVLNGFKPCETIGLIRAIELYILPGIRSSGARRRLELTALYSYFRVVLLATPKGLKLIPNLKLMRTRFAGKLRAANGCNETNQTSRSRETLLLSFPHRTQAAQSVNVFKPTSAAFFPGRFYE